MVVVGTSEPKNDGEKKGGKKKIKIHKSIFFLNEGCVLLKYISYIYFCFLCFHCEPKEREVDFIKI